MGGFVVDILVGYLVSFVRIAARKRRARVCGGWRETTATVAGVSWQAQFFMPRPDAEIVYTYNLDGRFYGGADKKPFYSESSAKTYASHFAKGDKLVVRVKPGEPEISVLLDEDQTRTSQSATKSSFSH